MTVKLLVQSIIREILECDMESCYKNKMSKDLLDLR